MGSRLSAQLILKKAAEFGVKLHAVDGRVKGRGPKPNEAFLTELRAHEAELVAFLAARPEPV